MRLLRRVVIGLGVLIILALAALVAGIVMKSGRKTPGFAGKGGWAAPLMAQVPAGAEVKRMALDGERLVVHVAHPDGSGELLVFDLRKGRLAGRIRLEMKE